MQALREEADPWEALRHGSRSMMQKLTEEENDDDERSSLFWETFLCANKINYGFAVLNSLDWRVCTKKFKDEPFSLFWCSRLKEPRCGGRLGGERSILCYNCFDAFVLVSLPAAMALASDGWTSPVAITIIFIGTLAALDSLWAIITNWYRLREHGEHNPPIVQVPHVVIDSQLSDISTISPQVMEEMPDFSNKKRTNICRRARAMRKEKIRIMLYQRRWLTKFIRNPSLFIAALAVVEIGVFIWYCVTSLG